MTTRLYYDDAYLASFDARVADIADDARRLYLDRTAFYPTSGGQPFDLGRIRDLPVVDVVDDGERVAHVLAKPATALAVGDAVSCAIDWPRRFDHMQQHTGQHLLSAVFADRFGAETVSVHFGAEVSSLDLAVDGVSHERLVAAEQLANEIVAENRAVTVSYEDSSSATGLRKPPPREGTLRIVTIGGADKSACGGTHVRATGEIGAILVRRVERVRKAARVEFVCGLRAVRHARRDFEMLGEIAQALSASVDEVPALVNAQAEQLRESESVRKRLAAEVATARARALYAAAVPDERDVRCVIERRATGSLDELRPLAQAFFELPKAVFIGSVSAPAVIVVATSEDSAFDGGASLKRALKSVEGKGGGSARLAQGTVSRAELLDDVVSAVLADLAAGT